MTEPRPLKHFNFKFKPLMRDKVLSLQASTGASYTKILTLALNIGLGAMIKELGKDAK